MKGKQYPQKTTINLVIKEKSPFRPRKTIPLLLLLLVLVAAFARFAVLDRLEQVSRAAAALAQAQTEVQTLEAATAEYDAVATKYRRYAANWMDEEERARVDRIEILALVERELMSVAAVDSVTVAENLLSVNLTGITLEGTSAVVQRLNTYPAVTGVSVYTASSETKEGVAPAVSILITLAKPQEEGTR